MRKALLAGAGLALGLVSAPAHGAIIAYTVPSNLPGNQGYSSLGLDFDVNSPGIVVSSLGIYNDDDNGGAPGGDTIDASPNDPLTVQIFDRTTGTVVPGLSVTFDSVSPGVQLNGSNYKQVAPVTLPIGQYSVVAFGLDTVDQNFNSGGGPGPSFLDDGGDNITFVGGGRFGGGADTPAAGLPGNIDGGPANRYAAGTFIYDPVPEPAALGLLGVVGLFVLRGRGRRA